MIKSFISMVGFTCILIFASCQNDAAELINVVSHAIPTANAGPSLVVQLPTNFSTLAGSGSSQNGAVASYLWTFVSGPNVPVIETPGNKVTNINSLIKGSYIFQLSVIDSAGFIGVDTATVTVKPDPTAPQTLLLQVTGNNNEQNFAVFNGANASFQSNELLAYASTNAPTTNIPFQIARGAFKIDLSSIPSGSTIISAKLNLYSNPTPTTVLQPGGANGGTNNAFNIFRLRTQFSNTTTWATQPQMDSSNLVTIPHTALSILNVEIDVKQIVDSMRTQGNNGFIIALQNENAANTNLRNFASSTNADAAKRPKLTIVYQ